MTLRSLSWILLLAVIGLGAWWAHDHPALQRWLPPTLRAALAPAPGSTGTDTVGPTAPQALRKCRGAGPVVYTDGDCPPGTRADTVSGGTLTVLPAVRPPAAEAAAAPAASAQSPLRRLAGPDDSAAQRERVLDQALHR